MAKALDSRLRALESRYGKRDPLPTIFVLTTDCSVPEPAEAPASKTYGDADIVGFYRGRRTAKELVARQPAESLKALQSRLERTLPDVRVFMAAYRHDEALRKPSP